jgi:FkbM family methyltransferase
MNWHTNLQVIRLRSIGRKLGLNRLIGFHLAKGGYEEKFDSSLLQEIRSGDVVWDVGANIGHYTRKFSEAVGSHGHIIAFEPFPSTLDRLKVNVADLRNVTVVPKALGREVAALNMLDGMDELGATSRITGGDVANCIMVEVVTGDHAFEQEGLGIPNVVKIDTEGFELDVLEGMHSLLGNNALRALFIEVHFALLEERGMASAPIRIEKMLHERGFLTDWVDPSHIMAKRS